MLRNLISSIMGFVLSIVILHSVSAQTSEVFFLGGIKWDIPASYIYARSQVSGKLTSVSLRFSLPTFSPQNSDDYNDILPEAAKPVLLVTITDAQKEVVGQALLNQIMAHAEVNCMTCVKDSSIGGKVYSNYATQGVPYQDIKNGIPYNLYVNQFPSSTWFMVCYFRPDLTPLPCEEKERLGKTLTITYKFPQEYISQAFKIGAEVRIILAKFQLPEGAISPEDASLVRPTATCWSPTPGSPGTETVPLHVGPELWQIPRAYAATFGSNQTQDPRVNGFQIFLKLPDLEPLNATDAAPFTIHGDGKYLSIFITYNDNAMVDQSSAFKIDKNGRTKMTNVLSSYIGKNEFMDYEERSILGLGNIITYISNDPSVNDTSFPPKLFECGQFSPGYNAICSFYVEQKSNLVVPGSPNAGYQIEYGFSRDYFSEITPISQCVQRLYKLFSNGVEN